MARFWPSRVRQLSELLALNRRVRTCLLSDCFRAMKSGEGAPAPGQKQPCKNGWRIDDLEGRMSDEEIHKKKRTGKTYISPRFETAEGPLRIASKVVDSEGLEFAKVKKEVVLRRTPTGRTEIIAKFLEDD